MWSHLGHGRSTDHSSFTNVKNENLAPLPSNLGAQYEKKHPYYLKYCSITKYHPFKNQGLSGGIVGHAVLYLKGVCKDSNKGPSGLKLCPSHMNFADSNTGVGISTDKGLKQVNFIAVPTLRTFLTGEIKKSEVFNNEVKQRLIKDVLNQGVFENIGFHEKMIPKNLPEKNHPEYVANYTFGSDYALAMARQLYCINIPVIKPIMSTVINELNTLNESYHNSKGSRYRGTLFRNKKPNNLYHWHGLYDNCTHTIVNLLAKIGQLPKKKINQTFLKQLFNIAVPADTLLEIHKKANLEDINLKEYFKDPIKRALLTKYNWIYQQEGVIAELIEIYDPNHIFKKDDRMLATPSLISNQNKKIRDMVSDPRFTYQNHNKNNYQLNLEFYYKKLTKALNHISENQKGRKYQKNLRRAQRYIDKNNQKSGQPSAKEVKAHEYISFVNKFKNLLETKKSTIEIRLQNISGS